MKRRFVQADNPVTFNAGRTPPRGFRSGRQARKFRGSNFLFGNLCGYDLVQ